MASETIEKEKKTYDQEKHGTMSWSKLYVKWDKRGRILGKWWQKQKKKII